MKNQDYDKALSLLQEYIIKKPQDFDAAQKRIQKIIASRIEFSKTADDLVDVIINEPLNDKKKLDMIASLESLLEKNPSSLNINFIQETKTAAQFTYYRAVFDDIMTRGEEEVQAERYSDAINIFYSGLDLYQKEFFEDNLRQSLKDKVQENLKRLAKLLADFSENLTALEEVEKEFSRIQKTNDLAQVSNYFPLFQDSFKSFAYYQNEIQEIGQFFNESFMSLQKENPMLTEASFLPFASRFILGKQNSDTTGIIASYNQQWEKRIEPLFSQAEILIQNEYKATISAIQNLEKNYSRETLEKADEYFNRAAIALENIDNLISLFNLRHENDGSLSKYQVSSRKENLIVLNDLLEEYRLYASNVERLENKKNEFYTAIKNSSNEVYTRSIFTNTEEVIAINNAFELSQERLNQVKSLAFESWLVFVNALDRSLDQNVQDNIKYLMDEWNIFANSNYIEGEILFEKYLNLYKTGYEALNPENKEDPISFLSLSYPSESLIIFNEMLKDIDESINSIQEKRENLLRSQNYTLSFFTPVVEDASNKLNNFVRELESLKTNTRAHIALAEERILLAQRAKNEAELRVSQVQNAINTNSFQTARDNLNRARAKYNESLEYQESAELRNKSDELLAVYANEITRKENELVVREVRNLKNEAKTAYYQGNFERAETLLVQAENRFAMTNVEKDPETTSLLILVGTALSMKTGRVILPSAPLYPEMSQILSLAKQYYERGQILIRENKRAEALQILNDAKKKIRELQIVYPLNQEASLLVLRIDQLIDPAAFTEFFAQRYTQARTDYRDLTKRQTAYTDLLDLAEINPRYPGLSDFIYNAEIEMGIRIRPPDQKALNESRQLTQEASLVINSSTRDEIQLNAALAKLNTALEKNPDNEEAMLLKDRAQIMIGGRASIVLSSESEDLYQRAILELQKGNVLQAAGIVNTLLQKRENQNSSKIIDLKKKVDSLL